MIKTEISFTTEGTPQFCRGAIEAGEDGHLCSTYATITYTDARRTWRFHFCPAHPPADARSVNGVVSFVFRTTFEAHFSRDLDPGLALTSARETASVWVPEGTTGTFDDESLTFACDRGA